MYIYALSSMSQNIFSEFLIGGVLISRAKWTRARAQACSVCARARYGAGNDHVWLTNAESAN